MTADPFGTAELRERVLAAWSASPDRFREDANAEEDLALGGYRDRLLVELAQNAADAAARAGVPGRLLLSLAETEEGPLLVAANTGAALDAAGVRALASLRASAKRDDDAAATVGRFGVGFAAVLAVTDEPALVAHGRGARFSRADTLALVRQAAAGHPGLAAELERRDDHVPVLRLPFPADGTAPTGYDTAVLLPLRDRAAGDLVDHLLGELDDALLLALPGLQEVLVERAGHPPVRLAGAEQRWTTLRRSGEHPPALLADRPTEERRRPGWFVTWALPLSGTGAGQSVQSVPAVLHAPTPTDEPLDWPALLLASFPLEPSRRHVAPGPATDALVRHAAQGYAELLERCAAGSGDVLSLVPIGLPAGALDAQLRTAVLDLLPGVPLLRAVEDGELLRPRDAVLLEGRAGADPEALAALAPVVAGLVAAPPAAMAALRALGVRRLALADVVDELPAAPDPHRWCARYAGLAGLADDPAEREALAALPVPLADGRVVRGVRGLSIVPAADELAGALGVLAEHGLRVVHPDAVAAPAAERLLERLGAGPAGRRQLLEDASVRAAVRAAVEADDAGEEVSDVTDAVLTLAAAAVAAGELRLGDLPWLGDLPLLADDGETAAAGLLVLPGSVAAGLLDPEQVLPIDEEVLRRWGAELLAAVGVADSLGLVRSADVDPHDLPEELQELDAAQDWADTLPDGTALEVVAVRDLDLVRDGGWPAAVEHLAGDPALRGALTDPVLVRTVDGTVRRLPPYTAWWLRRRLGLAGAADPDAEPALAALLPPAPEWAAATAPAIRSTLGLARSWADLDAAGWASVLRGILDPDLPLAVVLRAWAELARAAAAGRLDGLEPPARVRAVAPDGDSRPVKASDAVVPDAPMWLQRGDLGFVLPVPTTAAEPLADALDLDLASDRAAGRVAGTGQGCPVPDEVRLLLPGCPASWQEHDDLLVDGVEVEWWVEGAGPQALVHADTLAGLARGLAQAAGDWSRRLLVESVLLEPAESDRLLVEEALTTPDRPTP